MHVVIFEGPEWERLAPLSLSRPVFMLATGAGTLLDKIVRYLSPTRLSLWVRPQMVAFCERHVLPTLNVPTTINEPLDGEPALLVSARALVLAKFAPPQEQAVAVDEGDGGAIRCASCARRDWCPKTS